MKEEAERSLDQAGINWVEQRALERTLVANRLIGQQLLDVPCGYGRIWPTLDRLDTRYFGIDRDPDLVRKATGSDARNHGSRGACGDIFRLPFRDESFECVVCIRMLHLRFSDAERLAILCELARVSRRFVIISIYRRTRLHALMRRFNGTPGRLRFMTNQELLNLAQASGLRLQSAQTLLPLIHMQTFVVLTKPAPAD